MSDRDDIDRLRASWERRTRQSERSGCPENAFVGKVTSTTITAGHFGKVLPQLVTGAECEGCSATASDAAAVDVIVYNRGPGTLSAGDLAVVKWVRDRWVTGRKGTGSGGPNTCICPHGMPDTLTWTCQSSFSGLYLGTTTGSMTYMSDVRGTDSCFSFAVDGDGNPIPGWVGTFRQWGWIYAEVGDPDEPPPGGQGFLFDTCYDPSTIPSGFGAIIPGFCQWIVLLCSAPAGYGQLLLVKHNTSGGTTCTISEDFICISDTTVISCFPFFASVTPTGSCVIGDYVHVTA